MMSAPQMSPGRGEVGEVLDSDRERKPLRLVFDQPDSTPAEALQHELTQVILAGSAAHPRSQQKAMGPSELGEPCALRMAYKLLEWPEVNTASDPLPSIVGTGGHLMLEGYFRSLDETLPDGRPRYVVEQRVAARADIPGSCDLFDRRRGTVIDWKFPGATAMKAVKTDGPSQRYRVQAHAYGLGYENAGETVEHVAIAFLPRAGYLGGMHVWTEPYDRQVALDALQRRDDILCLTATLDVEEHPEAWSLIPRAAGRGCRYCPNYKPGSSDLTVGCPGDTTPTPDRGPAAG